MRRNSVLARVVVTLAAVVLVLLLAGVILCEGALRVPPALQHAPDERLAVSLAEQTAASWRAVEIRAGDGVPLSAWLFTPSRPNGRAVLVLHGVADTRTGVLAHARYLLAAGYAVLTPDSRAHGSSGGDLMTFGVRERSDVALWAAWLRREAGARQLYGLGESMGAAILLQSAGEFAAVVAECSFSTFREVARYRLSSRLGLSEWMVAPLVESGFLFARIRYGVDLRTASPVEHVRNTHVPVLLIHGLADTNIPPHHSTKLAAANPAAVLWLPQRAGHTAAIAVEPGEMRRRVLEWFDSHAAMC